MSLNWLNDSNLISKCYLYNTNPNYYTFDRHEIDFIIQYKNEIIPIEVKSNRTTNNISLTRYNEQNNNKIAIRFSMNNLSKNDKVLNIPLFLIEYMNHFI